ncbi:MAG: hypothetical protein IPI67_31565 [Myxococcales bacterium]|nr:hypothetical protein [Myxococcales bacterium]
MVRSDTERARTEESIRRVLENARLRAVPRVIVQGALSIAEIVRAESHDVDLAIIGLRLPARNEPAEAFMERMNQLLTNLPSTVLVRSSRGFQGEAVLFDDPGGPKATEPVPAAPATRGRLGRREFLARVGPPGGWRTDRRVGMSVGRLGARSPPSQRERAECHEHRNPFPDVVQAAGPN